MSKFKIIPFENKYKNKVIDLIISIQTQEFGIPISIKDQPDLERISSFYQQDNGQFWIAINEFDEVVGTLGLIDISHSHVALRKMFVAEKFRGKSIGVAKKLLETAINWCKAKNVSKIYLGTTSSYLAAHRFYEKNNFKEIKKNELPRHFPIMAVDSKFYVLDIVINR